MSVIDTARDLSTTTAPAAQAGPSADAYAEQLFHAHLGVSQLLATYAGERLGWFRALAERPATAAELAERSGTDERYCREWLELQASFGTLTVQPGCDPAAYALPEGPREVLLDEHSLAYLGALPRMWAAVGRRLDDLLDAYRTGGGVSWAELGDDARESQAALNRPWFESGLGPALAGLPEIHAALQRPGARIADAGCGGGWSTIALARAYPDAELVGFDVDGPSVDMARRAAAEAGVADRVQFVLADAATLPEHDQFDAAFAFECVHDLPRPVEFLSALRQAVRPGGPVVIMDEGVADTFEAGNEVDQFFYGFSLFVCLPDSMSSDPSAATGTVFRQPVLQRYAQEAGFSSVSVLPVEDFSFFRFYRLS